jgi:tetratricopeptide (TPR) repeat protein
MKNRIELLVLCGLLLAGLACAPKAPSAEETKKALEAAYEKAGAAVDAAKTPQEKTAACADFLRQYPESEYTLEMLETALYYQLEEAKDAAGAQPIVDGLLSAVKDKELVRKIKIASLPVFARLKQADVVQARVRDGSAGPLTFDQRMTIANACIEAGLWLMAEENASGALLVATPEAFKADNPGREFAPDRLERYTNLRKAECLAAAAWAKANLGRFDQAHSTFDQARPVTNFSYLGSSETNFNLWLGRTLLMQKEYDKAFETLTPDAVFGGTPEALAAFKEVFVARTGSEFGFDAKLEELRNKLAKAVVDFTLPDYAGREVTYSRQKEGKVMLLAFWFPT